MRWMATRSLHVDRRSFLAGLGGTALLGGLTGPSASFANALLGSGVNDTPLFASPLMDTSGSYAIGIFDEAGQEYARIGLPDRGHGIAISPDRQTLVTFARRPGTFALVVRPFETAEPQLITSETGRHFYGHGTFSADGRLLYAVENDYVGNRGLLGVYDVTGRTAHRIGEIETGGIGPHEVLLCPDGKSLVVANGGILTHPDQPREKLNLDTMQPSVAFIDCATGDLTVQHRLHASLHQLSLRHMTIDARGRSWVGAQYEGAETDTPPLVAHFSQDQAITLCELPDNLTGQLANYIGSVTANASGDVIATSAPRAGKVVFWNAGNGQCIGSANIPDACGVAPIDRSSFMISDGLGGMSFLETPGDTPLVLARSPGTSWDNHMSAL